MASIDKWIDIVTNPLGLVGFALFLVFIFLPKIVKTGGSGWVPKAAYFMALLALLGGMTLSYQKEAAKSQPSNTQNATPADSGSVPAGNNPVSSPTNNKETHGDSSPIIEGVGGDVNFSVNSGNSKD